MKRNIEVLLINPEEARMEWDKSKAENKRSVKMGKADKADVEQFKKDVAYELAYWHQVAKNEAGQDTNERWLIRSNQILDHPFLVPYLELLEQTRETCRECKGNKWVLDLYQKQYDCPTCHGTGKTELHPERLVVLNSDQSLPPVGEYAGLYKRQAQEDMLKSKFKRIKRESEK